MRLSTRITDGVDRIVLSAVQTWKRRPPPISLPVHTPSPTRSIAIPASSVAPGGSRAVELSSPERMSFESGVSLAGSLSSLDLDGGQSPASVENGDFVDV